MRNSLFADDRPDRLTRYRVITFVCAILIAGAWSIALGHTQKMLDWQRNLLVALTLFDVIVFFRWFWYARTTSLGVASIALGIAAMLLITF